MKKHVIFALLVFLLLFALVGCWDSVEISDMIIGIGTAYDFTEDGQIELTVEILMPSKQEQGYSVETKTITVKGATVIEAVQNLSKVTNNQFTWAYDQVLIIGEELSKQPTNIYIDSWNRSHYIRPDVYITISKGPAKDILNVENKDSLNSQAKEIANLMKGQISRGNGFSYTILQKDLFSDMMTEGAAAILPIIELNEKKEVELAGLAVFKDNTVVGELDSTETRGLLLARGLLQSSVFLVKDKTETNLVVLNLLGLKQKYQVKEKDGKVEIIIKLEVKSAIREQIGYEDILQKEQIDWLNQALAELIKAEILTTWEKEKELKADVLHLGQQINRYKPKIWQKLREDWPENIQKITLSIEVKTQILFQGDINYPIQYKN